MIRYYLSALSIALILYGCSTFSYSPPTATSARENVISLPVAREPFWRAFVAGLSADFFVINNLDKDTGLINVSYSGDPEKYVDCGMVKIGDNEFPGSKASHSYEVFAVVEHFRFTRRVGLEGRMNIVVQEVNAGNTTVTVNTRYLLSRHSVRIDSKGRTLTDDETASFNYGQDGTLSKQQNVTCRSTGALERQIIAVAQKAALPLVAAKPVGQ